MSLLTNIKEKNRATIKNNFMHQKFSLINLAHPSLIKQHNKINKYKETKVADIRYTALTPKHIISPPLFSGQ